MHGQKDSKILESRHRSDHLHLHSARPLPRSRFVIVLVIRRERRSRISIFLPARLICWGSSLIVIVRRVTPPSGMKHRVHLIFADDLKLRQMHPQFAGSEREVDKTSLCIDGDVGHDPPAELLKIPKALDGIIGRTFSAVCCSEVQGGS